MARVEMKKSEKIMHAITAVFFVISILYAVFYFGAPILQRLWGSINDAWRSLAAYVVLLFTGEEDVILPTVQEIPEGLDTVLPLTFEELGLFISEWWGNFNNWKNILAFLWHVLENLALALSYISLAIMPIAAIILAIWAINAGKDKDHAKDTKAVAAFEKFRRATWWPIKSAIKAYFRFFGSRWYYLVLFIAIWAYNFNFLTIAFEAVAWVFYISWVGTLDGIVSSFLVLLARFAVDFSVVALFIPGPLWWVIGYLIFAALRRSWGQKKLEKLLKEDEDFIDSYPGALFVSGKQRSKKTSMLTTLKLLYERKFRKKAADKMAKREKMFPFFPWIRVEKFIDKARAEHKIFMLYHCRRFVHMLRKVEGLPKEKQATYFRILKRVYGYEYDDFYFGYDVKYGLEYDDGIVKIHLFDALEMYTQLFFIYHQQTPLDLSNLAIREDFTWKDFGNFPVFDGDLLKKTSSESAQASSYSHVIDFDAFRPGMKFDPNNPNKDAIEYGVGVVQEVDKERKNAKTRSAGGNKGDGELGIATQDNDGFEVDLKVRGQVALVDFTDFWVWLIDAQRVGDLGASNAELTNQVFIKGTAEEYLVLPFFEVEDLLFEFLCKLYDKLHRWFRLRKGSNTLMHHLLKLIFEPIFKVYDRIDKRFTAFKLNVKVTDGGDGELLGMERFWILNAVTYRDRFASDVCKAFYEYRFARSKRGIDDIECYTATDTDVEAMMKQNSYFTEDMTVYNGQESRRKRAEQRKKAKSKSTRGNTH